jgi:hypothetical protein
VLIVRDLMLASEFLRRVVPRGHAEEEILVNLIATVEKTAEMVLTPPVN